MQNILKRTLLLGVSLFIVTLAVGQKSIAIINKSDSYLYNVYQKAISGYIVEPYRCDFNPAAFVEEEIFKLLGENYKVELISIPDEYSRIPGKIDGKGRAWIRSLEKRYDVILYLYTCRHSNRKLFATGTMPLYSSGILRHYSEKTGTFIYSSVTGRAFSTKSGVPFYHLDSKEINAIGKVENTVTISNFNDPALCMIISESLKELIAYRLKSLVSGLEKSEKFNE